MEKPDKNNCLAAPRDDATQLDNALKSQARHNESTCQFMRMG